MTDQPTRPIALTVLPENIPAELKQLPIWTCWRYEWNGKRWTKVPYTPFETSKASSTRESSWRSFQAAYNCYQERRDFFDGVFICVSEKDPYAGGDFDHSTDLARVPQTYAELSPSGAGIRFIGRGAIPAACKKPEGELYDRKRFLSITGHRLEGFPADILPIQPALDQLYDELKSAAATTKDGKPGSGDRAAHAAAISADEWEAGRQERRTNIHRLLGELRRRATNSRTGKRDTQLAYLLREDYTGFHERWPYVGIVREDGTMDSSQIRAVMANSIKGRGFSFPQFVALMSYFYGAECAKKWGTKQAVQEEFATLWAISRTPRATEYQERPATPVKRGRGSDHQQLLDRAFLVLEDYKAGVDSLITTQELADALNIHRRTAVTLLQELQDDGRITYKTMRHNAGIVVSYPGVINETKEKDNSEHTNGLNGHAGNGHISAEGLKTLLPLAVINETDEQHPNAENGDPSSAGESTPGVINEKIEAPEFSSTDGQNDTTPPSDKREGDGPSIYIYKQYRVSYAGIDHTPLSCKPDTTTCKDAVLLAFDELPKDRLDERSGVLKKWPVTNRRVVSYVLQEYPGRWKPEAVEYWAEWVRKRRKAETFDDLKSLKRDALEKRAATVRKRIEYAEKRADTDPMPEVKKYFKSLASRLEGQRALIAWELNRREQEDTARIDAHGYSLGEQQEFLELVERERKEKPPAPVPRLVQSPDAAGLIARLSARKQADGG